MFDTRIEIFNTYKQLNKLLVFVVFSALLFFFRLKEVEIKDSKIKNVTEKVARKKAERR